MAEANSVEGALRAWFGELQACVQAVSFGVSRRYEVSPIADADISAQCRWFMDRSLAVAKKFLKAVHQTILNIAENPESGSFAETEDSIGHTLSTRRRAVRGFEMITVYYVAKIDGVRILRVLHGARRITSSMILDD